MAASITPEQLQKWRESGRPHLLIDVLPEDSFEEQHLPDARNACVYEVAFLDKVVHLRNEHPDTPLVLYGLSDTFHAAEEAVAKLEHAGQKNLHRLIGGLEGWRHIGGKIEGQASSPQPTALHPDGTYPLELEHSHIEWTGRNLGGKHWGKLSLQSGEVTVTNGHLRGGRFTLDITSIKNDDIPDSKMSKLLVDHLLSSDFFEVENYPTGTFTITQVTIRDDQSPHQATYEIEGALTLKGRTHPITFPCSVGKNFENKIVAQAQLDIDRTRWHITYGSQKYFERLGKHFIHDTISLQLLLTLA